MVTGATEPDDIMAAAQCGSTGTQGVVLTKGAEAVVDHVCRCDVPTAPTKVVDRSVPATPCKAPSSRGWCVTG